MLRSTLTRGMVITVWLSHFKLHMVFIPVAGLGHGARASRTVHPKCASRSWLELGTNGVAFPLPSSSTSVQGHRNPAWQVGYMTGQPIMFSGFGMGLEVEALLRCALQIGVGHS